MTLWEKKYKRESQRQCFFTNFQVYPQIDEFEQYSIIDFVPGASLLLMLRHLAASRVRCTNRRSVGVITRTGGWAAT